MEGDAALVAAVRNGSREAAGQLVERHLRTCRVVALSIVGDLPAAEDVCQDAFVYAIERIDSCRQPDRFGAWLRQIVRSRARNHLRDRKVRRTEPMHGAWQAVAADSPAVDAERSELRDRLVSALAELPEERREVVLLHDLEGWTHQEIARQMDLPAGTVRSHLHHARRRLRELLGELRRDTE
jgi:RNA polymerase sigma-70 factor, ECF subfamily